MSPQRRSAGVLATACISLAEIDAAEWPPSSDLIDAPGEDDPKPTAQSTTAGSRGPQQGGASGEGPMKSPLVATPDSRATRTRVERHQAETEAAKFVHASSMALGKLKLGIRRTVRCAGTAAQIKRIAKYERRGTNSCMAWWVTREAIKRGGLLGVSYVDAGLSRLKLPAQTMENLAEKRELVTPSGVYLSSLGSVANRESPPPPTSRETANSGSGEGGGESGEGVVVAAMVVEDPAPPPVDVPQEAAQPPAFVAPVAVMFSRLCTLCNHRRSLRFRFAVLDLPLGLWLQVGDNRLSVNARQAVNAIMGDGVRLGEFSLAGLTSSFHGTLRRRRRGWSAGLHYADSQDCTFEYDRDCKDDWCVAGAIKNYTRRVADESLSRYERQWELERLCRPVRLPGTIRLITPARMTRSRGLIARASGLTSSTLSVLDLMVGGKYADKVDGWLKDCETRGIDECVNTMLEDDASRPQYGFLH
ncbi:hypothetical protein FOZ60_007061 [Perkinsus olseni]|uniref:Uncharacterized protein n=1 Tax=Perkinsus olseni TaxID=32597 RepID=A0A7J6NN51_PEROL|nr:hypothetical protein FOZ60_007061 [Perkinsus olseni]